MSRRNLHGHRMARVVCGFAVLLVTATLLTAARPSSPQAPAPNAIDAMEARIQAQLQQLVAQEKQKQVIPGLGGQVDHDFMQQLGDLQKQFDEHVTLARMAEAKEQGRLADAMVLAQQWERDQQVTGLEADPDVAQKIQAIRPSWNEVLTDVYETALATCIPSNANANTEVMVGAVHLDAVLGGGNLFPDWYGDASNCAKLAPLFLEFDSHVELDEKGGNKIAAYVQATGVKLSFDKQTTDYVSDAFPLQYVSLDITNSKGFCTTGNGVSGTLAAVASVNRELNQVTLQVFPNVSEQITIGQVSLGGSCAKYPTGAQRNYWLGFVLTGGTDPIVMNLDQAVDLEKTVPFTAGSSFTQKTDISLAH